MSATNRYPITVTAASGTAAFNTPAMFGEITLIGISPLSTDTTYEFTVTDPEDMVVYGSKAALTGEQVFWVSLPARGVYGVDITGASADEAIKCQVCFVQA
jgi:hypothetical protein